MTVTPRKLRQASQDGWRDLAARAVEPNGYYLPGWQFAVDASARDRSNVDVLTAALPASPAHPVAVLPVISLWRAYRIPLPALVSADPYGTLGTPLIDRDDPDRAANALLDEARAAGAHALILRDATLKGEATNAVLRIARQRGVRPRILHSHARACLDATRDSDDLLRDALGAKKLKELRRQRNRLAEHGPVTFEVARTPSDVATARSVFLALEASGWKARRGTALGQHEGDLAFITRATDALARTGQCEIVTLRAGDTPVAAAIVLRHLDRAFYFKLGVDERFAKLSPGVQLTIDLTRYLCADPAIASADSTAAPGHPMIDPIWRGRLAIGDVLIPVRNRTPVAAAALGAMRIRQLIREPARRALHLIRKSQEKSS